MSDIKLFSYDTQNVSELAGCSAPFKKDLQSLIKDNWKPFWTHDPVTICNI